MAAAPLFSLSSRSHIRQAYGATTFQSHTVILAAYRLTSDIRRSARPASVDSLRSRPCITGCYVALPRCRSGEQCHHYGRPVDSWSDVLGGQWQCGVEVLRTDRYRVAYPIAVPPRSLIVKPSSACLSAMSMSS